MCLCGVCSCLYGCVHVGEYDVCACLYQCKCVGGMCAILVWICWGVHMNTKDQHYMSSSVVCQIVLEICRLFWSLNLELIPSAELASQ